VASIKVRVGLDIQRHGFRSRHVELELCVESNVSDGFETAISKDESVQGFESHACSSTNSFRVIVYDGN
jgi:hypothetical protein